MIHAVVLLLLSLSGHEIADFPLEGRPALVQSWADDPDGGVSAEEDREYRGLVQTLVPLSPVDFPGPARSDRITRPLAAGLRAPHCRAPPDLL